MHNVSKLLLQLDLKLLQDGSVVELWDHVVRCGRRVAAHDNPFSKRYVFLVVNAQIFPSKGDTANGHTGVEGGKGDKGRNGFPVQQWYTYWVTRFPIKSLM